MFFQTSYNKPASDENKFHDFKEMWWQKNCLEVHLSGIKYKIMSCEPSTFNILDSYINKGLLSNVFNIEILIKVI